jgi:PAS domain S-box-containing protein
LRDDRSARGRRSIGHWPARPRYVDREGSLVKQASFFPELDPERAAVRVIGVADVLSAMHESTEAALSAAVEQTADGIMITDAAGLITYVNPSFVRISGYTRAEVIGRTRAFLESGRHDRAFYSDIWATIVAGRTWAGTIFNRRKDGDLYETALTISPCAGPDGRITSYVEVSRDLTQVRALEAELLQAANVEAAGLLAQSGIAHDFNNLLTVIHGFSGMLLADLEPSDAWREIVEEIVRAADRAAVLTRELSAFSRRQILQPKRVDLNAIIADILAMLRLTVGEAIVLDVRPHGTWMVSVDPGHLVQVILNLAVNARDAMPSGGTLTIETTNLVTDARRAATGRAGRRSEYVLLSVSDTGVGLSQEAKTHLFEPFFTTKGQGKGTGLGLASVYGFAEHSGGHVAADSAPGAGTRFNIYLPRVAGEPEPLGPVHPLAVRPAGSSSLLLVEDDPAVLAIAKAVLVREGYTVLRRRPARRR